MHQERPIHIDSVMEKDVEFLNPNSTIKEAADKMMRSDVGVLPVCEGNRVLGMITDRDIVVRAVAKSLNPEQVKVQEVMSEEVVSCNENDNIENVVQKMQDKRVGRLVVLDSNQRLKGLISLGNIVKELGEEHLSAFVHEKIAGPEGRRQFRRFDLSQPRQQQSFLLGLVSFASIWGLYQWGRYLSQKPSTGRALFKGIQVPQKRAA